MSSKNRREILKCAVGALGVGGAVSASGCLGADGTAASMPATMASDHGGLPSLRGPYADEDWVGERGGPGNTARAATGPDVGDSPECRLFYEPEPQYHDEAAIVDDTMYITTGGRVRALDTSDGSVRWTSDEVDMLSTPSAAYGTLFAAGVESVTALDVEDRTVEWNVPYEDRVTTPSVGYEMVFVVMDGAIRALDVSDGSTVWERESDGTGEDFRHAPLALGAEQVYAIDGSDNLVALDAANGEQLWTDNTQLTYSWGLAATDRYVTGSSGRASEEYRVLDAETGQAVAGGSSWRPPAFDDEAIVNVTHWDVRVHFFDDRDSWQTGNFSTMAVGPPAMDDDTVYVYVGDNGAGDPDSYTVIAYDKYSGDRRWTCDVGDSVDSGGSVAVTGDAAYAFGYEEIHVIPGEDRGTDDSTDDETTSDQDDTEDGPADGDATDDGGSTEADDGSSDTGGGSGETDGGSTGTDDGSTDGGSATETDGGSDGGGTGTPTDTDGSSGSGGGRSTAGDGSPTAESGTPTDGTPTADGDGGTAERVAVEEATETSEDGPGLGVVSAISGLGGLGYLLRRRLADDDSDAEPLDQ